MKCLKCKKPIGKNEKHYRIKLWDKGKEIAEDDVHYSCWQEIFNPSAYLKQAGQIVRNMLNNKMEIPA